MQKLFDVIFEDADLLVLNKPAGLVCHPTKNGEMSSLIGRVRLHLLGPASPRAESGSPGISPHLVNRLDRETGGVVVVAKNSAAAGELGKLLESRAVKKEYLAIVHGHVAAERGTVDAPLGKDESSRVAIKDCACPDGAAAQTDFIVEKRFFRAVPAGPSSILHPPSAFSLLRVLPRTGRKHQIRIHLAHLGYPIVGDKIYGGDEDLYLALVEDRLTPEQRARLILPHHALHASGIKFFWRGAERFFTAPPEVWFTDFAAD